MRGLPASDCSEAAMHKLTRARGGHQEMEREEPAPNSTCGSAYFQNSSILIYLYFTISLNDSTEPSGAVALGGSTWPARLPSVPL